MVSCVKKLRKNFSIVRVHGWLEFLSSPILRTLTASYPMQYIVNQAIQERLQQPLSEALGPQITALLKPSDYANLATIASLRDGGTRLTHVIRWLRAIHENRDLHSNSAEPLADPERWFIKIMAEYRGSINMLRNFCTFLECPDPILAARTAQLHFPGTVEIPSDLIEQVPDLRAGQAERKRHAVRGASGTMLVGEVYWAENKNSPGSLGFFAGIRATLRILETFGGERHKAANLERIRVRRDNALRDEFRKALSLDDLISNPRLERILGSPLVSRKLAVYQQLEPIAAQVRADINMALYASSVFGIVARQAEFIDDPGGQMRAWYSKQTQLPAAVASALAEYYDQHLDHTPAKETALAKILVGYYRAKVLIADSVIIDPIKRDLEALRSLKQTDPLRQHYEPIIANALPLISQQLKAEGSVLTMAEVAALLQAAPLDELRLELNKVVYSHFEQEILRARSRVRKLFGDKSGWFDDLYRDSIPMARLRETIYGQPLTNGGSVLGYNDFAAIKRVLVAAILVPNRDDLLRSIDAQSFKQLIEEFLKASRKLIHYDEILRVTKRGDISRFQPVVRRDLELAEKFVGPLPYSEIITRVADRKLWPRRNRARADMILSEARAGLISPSGLQVAQECASKVKNLTARKEHRDLLAAAQKVAATPLVKPIWSKLSDVVGFQYFTPDEVSALQLIADSAKYVEQKLAQGDKLIAERQLAGLRKYRYIEESHFAAKFSLSRREFSSVFPPERSDAVDIYTPDAIAAAYQAFKSKYVRVTKLSAAERAAVQRNLPYTKLAENDCISKQALERVIQGA